MENLKYMFFEFLDNFLCVLLVVFLMVMLVLSVGVLGWNVYIVIDMFL